MEFKSVMCPSCVWGIASSGDKEIVNILYCGNDIIVKKCIVVLPAEGSITYEISRKFLGGENLVIFGNYNKMKC